MKLGADSNTKRQLHSRRIAIPESRQLDVFAQMLETRGATVHRCPLVNVRDAPDPAPIQAWLQDFAAGSCDDLILLTGEGLRRLLGAAERVNEQLHAGFVTRLAKVRTITRGPKPARELRGLGLRADLLATAPTTDGVIETLRNHNMQGRIVGVQLYGTDPNEKLTAFLRKAGARPLPVAPYVYADEAEDGEVISLIELINQSGIDAIAFTSSAQVRRLFSVAKKHGLEVALSTSLNTTVVAAVGPVVANTLHEKGINVDLMPSDNYFMKPLVRELVKHLQTAPTP